MAMPLLFATRSDVDAIWSIDGVDGRMDDDGDSSLNTTEEDRIDVFIERASIKVGTLLRSRLSVSVINGWNPTTAPNSVRYATAVIASCFISLRRGNPVPIELKNWCDEVVESLKDGPLPIDIAEEFNTTPFVSNLTVDLRFPNAKVRVIESTSTDPKPGEGIKRFRELFDRSWADF